MTDILTGIFSRILNTSVAACFLIGAVFLLRFVFRKVAPKTIICFLWGIVALRLVLPFSIQSPIGLVPEKASTVASVFETATEAKPAEMVTPVETLTPIDPVSPAEPTANDPQQTVPVTQPDLQTVDPVTPYPQSPVTASVEADSQSGRSGTIETVSESSIGIGFILSLIWIAGLAGMLTYVLIHYLLLRKKMADSVPYLQGVRQSEKVRSPFVLGLFRPVIYLPFGLDKQTESHVLAHERAHISRGDHWFKFLWFAVLAVHWFNPLAWLAFILLCGDIEYACDERVLSTMEEPDKKAYAESLLGLGISSRRVSACPVAFGETNVKNRIRRVFDFKKPAAWILALILFSCILLTACFSTVSVSPVPGEESRSEPVSDSEQSETSSVQPRIQAPTVFQNSKMLYCNQFDSMGEPPFSLPEGSPDIDQGYGYHYSYNNITVADCDSFVSNLENSGFGLVTMKYSRFLFRDDCMIFMNYSEDKELLTLSWYSRSQYANDDGEGSSLSWYDGKNSLSKIKIHPINVTPKGFYDLTGGQMFAIPYYSYDSFKASGQDSLMFEDNEWYYCSVCFVKGDTVLNTSMESIAVCDVDGDQLNDVLLLSFGPTSGLFTFNVTVLTKNGIYDTIFNTDYYNLGFANKGENIVVEGVGYDLKQHFFDIVLEKDGDETIVMLYDAGESLRIWGIPNTRNFTVLLENSN